MAAERATVTSAVSPGHSFRVASSDQSPDSPILLVNERFSSTSARIFARSMPQQQAGTATSFACTKTVAGKIPRERIALANHRPRAQPLAIVGAIRTFVYARSLSEYYATLREQIEQNWAILFYVEGLPTVPLADQDLLLPSSLAGMVAW